MSGTGRAYTAGSAAVFHVFQRLYGSFGGIYHFKLLHTALFQLSAHDLCQGAHGGLVNIRYVELSRVQLVAGAHAADNGNARSLHGLLCGSLVTQHSYGFGAGADENYIIFKAQLGKIGILGQKSEAGVNCLCACHLARFDYCGSVKVAVLCGGRTYAHSLVGDLCVKCVLICGGIDRDGMYAQLSAGTDYSYGYFASVCYKNLFKHFIQSLSVTLLQM